MLSSIQNYNALLDKVDLSSFVSLFFLVELFFLYTSQKAIFDLEELKRVCVTKAESQLNNQNSCFLLSANDLVIDFGISDSVTANKISQFPNTNLIDGLCTNDPASACDFDFLQYFTALDFRVDDQWYSICLGQRMDGGNIIGESSVGGQESAIAVDVLNE